MRRNVSIDIPLGGGSGSSHHHRPWGPAPFGLLYDDHLFLRIARMTQAVGHLFEFLASPQSDRIEFIDRAKAIVLTIHCWASLTELLVPVLTA